MSLRAALLAVLAIAGCGYAPLRTGAPEGIRRVAVEPFTVAGTSPELGAWLGESAAGEIAASDGIVLSNVGAADAVVRGRAELSGDPAVALGAGAGGPRAVLAAPVLEVRAVLVGRDGATLRRVGPLRVRLTRTVDAAGGADLARESRGLRALAGDAGRVVVRALFAPAP